MSSTSDDRTTQARIRDAALTRFARDGVPATTLRGVAADAGVSVGLVAHHFGSKEGLRRAVDHYVVSLFREKLAAFDSAQSGSAMSAMINAVQENMSVVRYLSRAFLDETPEAAALFDDLVALTESLLAEGERAGMVQPSTDPRMRAAMLTTWDLGGLMLSEHFSRAVGTSVLEHEGLERWTRALLEVSGRGLVTSDEWLTEWNGIQDTTGGST